MPKKTTTELEDLQGDLADVCRDALADMRSTGEWNAGVINAARQLLKDNGVVTVPEKGSPMGDLADILPFDEKDRMVK